MDGAVEIPPDVETDEIGTEETTEPIPPSELDALLARARVADGVDTDATQRGDVRLATTIHLDELVVPPDKDIRLLVRPLRSRSVSPGMHDNCEWVALRAEQPHETVLAVTQTSEDIKFTVHVPGERHGDTMHGPPLWCELYYDPESDNQILLSHCDMPISLSRVFPSTPSTELTNPASDASDPPSTPDTPSTPHIEYTINPGTVRALSPGTWRIKVGPVAVLDFRILEKRQPTLLGSPLLPVASLPSKRSLDEDSDDGDHGAGPHVRRQKTERTVVDDDEHKTDDDNKEGVIMFLSPAVDPLVFPLPTEAKAKTAEAPTAMTMTTTTTTVARQNAHALLDMGAQDTLVVPGARQTASYQLTKREPIASPALSSVFAGTVTGHPRVPSDRVVTVKVVKTRPSSAAATTTTRNQDTARVVVRQADTWLREYKSHEYLRHDNIVRLYGGDARFLSLYMERIDAQDLASRAPPAAGGWRHPDTSVFRGDRADAQRILRDIAGALAYCHAHALVHNDVKPANILYARARGAVLCDLGLSTSTRAGVPASEGGTPYYVPPEFIGRRQRGPPSDVWALGITMLYVLRMLPLPGSRGGGVGVGAGAGAGSQRRNRPPLYWLIADINKAPTGPVAGPVAAPAGSGAGNGSNIGDTATLPAVVQMQMWLTEVNATKERLNRDDLVERLVLEMLAPNPLQRVTMERVVEALGEA